MCVHKNNMTDTQPKTFLYFGIFDPEFSRNKVYIRGLQARGHKVVVVTDRSRGPLKFLKLWRMHRELKGKYDVMVVGYPGYIIVPFARVITRKPIFFDALCSFHEAQIISRNAYKNNPLRIPYVRTIDWLATRSADKVMVETELQKEYFVQELKVPATKCIVVYTGVDDTSFYFDPTIAKNPTYTVLFRGRIMEEAGVTHILRAAEILRGENIRFLIIGFGWSRAMENFSKLLKELALPNVCHIRGPVPIDELRPLILSSHVSLGQFSNNSRLDRTIPHKAFEAMAMRLPYITARKPGIQEVLTDKESCLLVEAEDPRDLADRILFLKNNPAQGDTVVSKAFELYEEKYKPAKIVESLLVGVESLL